MSGRSSGKSIMEIPTDYTIIDLETTGLDPHWDNIIEVACIKYRGGEEAGRIQSLIQPPIREDADEDGLPYIDGFIEKLTGITNDMLKDAPMFKDIESQIEDFLAGELLVGHNVKFDINFLHDSFAPYDVPFENDFVDTMRISRRVLPDLPHHRLGDLADYFNISGTHHRAMGDCEMTHGVLLGLAGIIKEKGIELAKKDFWREKIDLRSLQANPAKFIKDHIFYDRICVFTGKLERLTRQEAAQIVVNIGGHCENGVTKRTNFLIVGNFDYRMHVKGNKSTKMQRAEQLILKGQDLQIMSESAFYDLIEGEID